jgi:alpha-mannosidase
MKEYTCTIVSHTHWDREWYLPFQVFRLRLVELVDTVLEILGRDPDFRAFTLDGQAILLEDYLQVRPEREEELRSFVQADLTVHSKAYIDLKVRGKEIVSIRVESD